MSKFKAMVLNTCHETLDLFPRSVELAVYGNKFEFLYRDSGPSVSVIADESGEGYFETGLHTVGDESFNETELIDLLERATRNGYDQILVPTS